MRWAGPDEVERALPPLAAIAAVDDALRQLEEGRAGVAERQFHGIRQVQLAVMPGHVEGYLGLKAVTVVAENPSRGLPSIQGLVAVFAADGGELLGAVDGPALTAVRTAAIAGLATRVLSAPDAHQLLMVGAGAQARFQIEAVLAVRPISRLTIWNRTRDHAAALAKTISVRHPDLRVEVADDLLPDVRAADVISLATGTREPLL
ncbi:MAG TPA: ornithine cyclodeaminase family protein, partial [Chloroflexota bacterium]|nr:ornithine cyclodeaminase family protein [Chloroflexota bacterium]